MRPRDRRGTGPARRARRCWFVALLVVALLPSPASAAWTSLESVSPAASAPVEPDVAIGPAGEATAVWRRFDGFDDRVQVSAKSPGGAWSAPEPLSAPGRDAAEPHAAYLGDTDVV